MELALYHPEFGYYTRTTNPNGNEQPDGDSAAEQRIGWSGDYYTSTDVHPIFSRALARQLDQVDACLGRPDPFTVIEMGAGKGLLACDFLTACEQHFPGLFARLRYVLIERSPAMIAAQRESLAPWLGTPRVSWLNGLANLPDGAVTGVVLSNELVDAFPVHRIRMVQGQPRELYVDYRDGRFVEQEGELSTPELGQYLRRLAELDIALPDGYTTEINLHALAWMREVARVLGRGVALTIDYGHTAQDLYGPDRSRGTLLCYTRHRASENPYVRVGLQDITAHVDFSALAASGEAAGLHTTGFTNQMSFLMGLGAEELFASLEPDSPELHAAIRLLRPDGMGRTFKMLVQHKGIAQPALDGLTFKPFAGSALAPCGAR